MKYCVKCIQPDTRPGMKFDREGVCLPCRFAEKNEQVSWDSRRRELEAIAEFGRKRNVSGYDCLIGVSGGKDSVRQSLFIRNELELNPLLVSCVYPPEQLAERGAHNISNLISLGFDCISVSPDPQAWKAMMRKGFLEYGNWAKSTETALHTSLPKVATAYHIPLIFLGENPAITLGASELASSSEPTGSASDMHRMHTMLGGPEAVIEDWIMEKNLFWYRFPPEEDIRRVGIMVVYLGYYIKDFTRFKNGEVAIAHGLEIRKDPPEDTGDVLGYEALDEDFVIINQMFKYLKHGFGKVTDQTSEGVRLGMITRPEAVKLAKKYDGKCAPRFISRFCEYLEIDEKQFWDTAERFRNKDIWAKDKNGNWKLKVGFNNNEQA